MRNIIVDFETAKIERRPKYPPKPVGVAIKDGSYCEYLAWGHPIENNCTVDEAREKLRVAFMDDNAQCIFHNCAFDIDVAQTHLDLPYPKHYGDTQFLAFLNNPREHKLRLKELADTYCGMPPEEQADLMAWIMANVPIGIGEPPAAWISKAPGGLVGVYAKGDVIRTEKLFDLFYPSVIERGMGEAYQTELDLVKVKLYMERSGLTVNYYKLVATRDVFDKALEDSLNTIKEQLNIDDAKSAEYGWHGFQNKPDQLRRALPEADKVQQFIYTKPTQYNPQGLPSVKINDLRKVCSDEVLVEHISIHNLLTSYKRYYVDAWLKKGDLDTSGILHPSFNQLRTTDNIGGRGVIGTKTGRPSSSHPNFNNIPRSIDTGEYKYGLPLLDNQGGSKSLIETTTYLKRYEFDFNGIRDLIVPDSPDSIFINRDYNQQEFRILACYEKADLLAAYQSNHDLDMHTMVRDNIARATGRQFDRETVKKANYAIIYGAGDLGVSNALDVPLDEAKEIRQLVLSSLPGVKTLDDRIRKDALAGQEIQTFGGRLYSIEKNADQYLSYKMLNLLIQGSAADVTKQAMLRVFDAVGDVRLQVYDEIMCCVPKDGWESKMALMKEAMESVGPYLQMQMPTRGYVSSESWAKLESTE